MAGDDKLQCRVASLLTNSVAGSLPADVSQALHNTPGGCLLAWSLAPWAGPAALSADESVSSQSAFSLHAASIAYR